MAASSTSTTLAHRTLDAAQIADLRSTDAELVAMTALLRRLSHCTMGKRLLEVALGRRLKFSFAGRLSLWYPGRGVAAAQYCPGRYTVRIGRSATPDVQLAVLAHELQHFCDEALGWGSGWTVQSEVRALQAQALVIQELGLDATCDALGRSGELLPAHEIATRVRANRAYAGLHEERPRRDGRTHPLLDACELTPGMPTTGRSARVARAVLIQGPATHREARPGDTAWCPARELAHA